MTKTKRLIVKYGTEQAWYDFGFYHETVNSAVQMESCMSLSDQSDIHS